MEVNLYIMILKNVCSIISMQEVNDTVEEDEYIKNIYKILGLEENKYLPYYLMINEYLLKLNNEELEKIRKDMIYSLIRKKSFDNLKFLSKHWLVIVDDTQLFSFKERHCEHCLTKTFNKGTNEEKTIYYHQILEAKIVFADNFTLSIATEFLEYENKNQSKEDCQIKSFKKLSKSLKKMFPRLPICIMADSLYACDTTFKICKDNKWEFLIRCKDGSIPSLIEEYKEICDMGEEDEEIIEMETVYKIKPEINAIHTMKWVNALEYKKFKVSVTELEIEKRGEKTQTFKWITSIILSNKYAKEFSETGRKSWLIENEGVNTKNNHKYIATYPNNLNYNAMKNHYLLIQLADAFLQLYECDKKEIKIIKQTISNISEALINCGREQNTSAV